MCVFIGPYFKEFKKGIQDKVKKLSSKLIRCKQTKLFSYKFVNFLLFTYI